MIPSARRSHLSPVPVLLLALLAASCGRADRELQAATAAAGTRTPAVLVKDLRLGSAPQGSSPSGFAVAGAVAYFSADDGSSGRELWRTDGTGPGTALVKDVLPGGGSSHPSDLAVLGTTLLFAADDGARGRELWKTDGTEAGTVLVKDVEPGSRGSSPRHLTRVGTQLFFVADTAANGAELWKTDGTEAGTVLVRDIVASPGPEIGSNPAELVVVGSTLFFVATDSRGTELWKSDGTATGTTLVHDIDPAGSSSPRGLTAWNGKVWFGAGNPAAGGLVQLWSSDGTPGGTGVVEETPATNPNPNPTEPSLLTVFGSAIYYRAWRDGEWNLWSTVGTAQTRLTTGVDPAEMAVSGGRLLLSATRAAEGREIFAWNGAVLSLVADIAGGTASSSPAGFVDLGGTLFFRATAGGFPTLWRSDGTPTGTRAVFATGGPEVGEIAALGSLLLFGGADGAAGAEPWRSDGTEAGSLRVANLRGDAAGADPRDLAIWSGDGLLYFSADDGTSGRELFRSDGTDAGTGLAWDVYFGPGASANVGDLVDLGPVAACGPESCGGLLFGAFDAAYGRELWRWDGAMPLPAAVLADLRAGPVGSAPSRAVPLGPVAFFAADDGSAGRELWRTDGSAPGTTRVRDIAPGLLSSNPGGLVPAGGLLWFSATQNGGDYRPFRSDGTSAGTFPVGVSSFLDLILDPEGFTELGGQVLFAATSGENDGRGRELFLSNGTSAGTRLVKDLAPGPASSSPALLGVHAGRAWLSADAGGGVGLHATDGTDPGTVLVKAIGTRGAGEIGSAASVAGRLLFVANDEAHGPELWASDGTAAGTALVRDALDGPLGSATGSVLVPLPTRGRVLYAATDGATGTELWISNGTRLGTRLLHDLRPGPEGSNPAGFLVSGETVWFGADDGVSGRELWALDVSAAALDLTPPVPSCGPAVAEATEPGGARPALSATATDDLSTPAEISFAFLPPAGSLFPLGTTPVVATAADASGNLAECTFDVTVVDTTPPAMTCPATAISEATGPSGALATYPPAAAVDLVTASPSVLYSKGSGTLFPLGDTAVTATGTDATGNSASCVFTVRVRDTTPPTATCPATQVAAATGPSGATVSYPPATASDVVSASGSIAISHDLPSGSTFPLGTTTVTATATDEAGNAGTCAFSVVVEDRSPPSISCPPAGSFEATGPSGADATWTDATATDLETVAPAISYDPARGSVFPLGDTTVTATATDVGGNTASCTFTISVADTTPPAVSCPANGLAEATGPSGAAVAFGGAIATDVVTAAPSLAYEADLGGGPAPAPSGTTFPLGTTLVTVTATDGSGNGAGCVFTVRVVDTTGPSLVCPAPISAEAETDAGVAVSFAAATATDAVTASPTVVAAPASGSTFLPGVTTVTFTAIDDAGNASSCTTDVTVTIRPPPAPSGGCGCGSGGGGSLALGGLLLALLGRRRRGEASPR